MKRTNRIKSVIAALLLFTITPFILVPSYATTPLPPSLINGTDAMDAQPDKNSGAVIENQTITFNPSDFPLLYDAELSKDYTASVTTEYTLFNPTDNDITFKVAFPINNAPDYYYSDNGSETTNYSVFVNGERIEAELRYYLNIRSDSERNLISMISDEYINNELCGPNTTVTKYVFKQSGVSQSDAYAGIDIEKEGYIGNCFYINEQSVNSFDPIPSVHRITVKAGENGSTIELCVIGKEPEQLPEWKFYSKFTGSDDSEIEGKMELVGKETSTLLELVSEKYDESFGINEIDWFNMAATEIGESMKNGIVHTSLSDLKNGYSHYRGRCFIYEITLPSKERVVNTINAPVFPSVETMYEPYVYEYNYLLYKEKAEMFTGQITVNVNTPYFMLHGDGFEKTDYGYSLTVDPIERISENATVTHGGFYFTLCEVEEPVEVENDSSTAWIILGIIVTIILLPIMLIEKATNFISKGIGAIIQKIKGGRR